MITACFLYTLRVLIAWWVIARIKAYISKLRPLWSTLLVFYISVFIGAELAFIADFFSIQPYGVQCLKC